MITGLSHLTFAVGDLEASLRFYTEDLGLRLVARGPRAAYLLAGESWIALVEDGRTRSGPLPEYSHAAFRVEAEALPGIAARLEARGVRRWQENRTFGDSLYILDPDGHKLELHGSDLEARLAWLREQGGGEWAIVTEVAEAAFGPPRSAGPSGRGARSR